LSHPLQTTQTVLELAVRSTEKDLLSPLQMTKLTHLCDAFTASHSTSASSVVGMAMLVIIRNMKQATFNFAPEESTQDDERLKMVCETLDWIISQLCDVNPPTPKLSNDKNVKGKSLLLEFLECASVQYSNDQILHYMERRKDSLVKLTKLYSLVFLGSYLELHFLNLVHVKLMQFFKQGLYYGVLFNCLLTSL
jgi:hypothetical protein